MLSLRFGNRLTPIHLLYTMEKLLYTILLLSLISSCNTTVNPASDVDVEEQTALSASDTLPFTITEGNNIVFKAILDGTDTLDFYFDTGGTDLVIKHSAVKNRTSLLEGRNENYSEENFVPLEGLYALSLNNLSWDSLTIYPTEVGPEEADGHFGWDLFRDKVVELDYDNQRMIVHTAFSGDLETYSKLEIEYTHTLFCIQGTIKVGENEFPNRYLFDSGFQRAVILDKDLREKSQFPDTLPVIKESRLKNSEGTEFINQVVNIDEICFENSCASEVPIQLLSTPNPARFETHILGNELLKRFNTILDFQNGFVYLKPNSLMVTPYRDAG